MTDQVRISYMGSFVDKTEAENYHQEFYDFFGQDIKDGHLVVIEDKTKWLNFKWVVRIMAENAQMELFIPEENETEQS